MARIPLPPIDTPLPEIPAQSTPWSEFFDAIYKELTQVQTFSSSANVTRPNNATPYAIGDVVNDGATPGARLNFTGLPARGGEIRSAVCVSSAYVAVSPDLELWLFSSDITDLDADNATWTPTDAQLATLVGVIAFPTASFKGGDLTAGAGGNMACVVKDAGLVISQTALYGVLVVRNAYVPVANEKFTVTLKVSY